MVTKHINEYKLFPIHSIPDGAMFVPKTDLPISENTYVYIKICSFDVESYMGYSVEDDDIDRYVYSVNTDGEIECFSNDVMVYCVSEYDYKFCI